MTTTTYIAKLSTFYGAYAPELNVSAYGDCRDEALNNLTQELADKRDQNRIEEGTGDERKT